MKIEDGNIILDLNDFWRELPDETKARFLQNDGAWEIIEQELLYLQGDSLSTPSFNNSIHKVRELILTNPEFVDNVLISFVKTCLEEWAKERQKAYAAERAYWKLYHLLDWDTSRETKHRASSSWELIKMEHPEDWSKFPSIHREDVKKEILDAFQEIIQNFSQEV